MIEQCPLPYFYKISYSTKLFFKKSKCLIFHIITFYFHVSCIKIFFTHPNAHYIINSPTHTISAAPADDSLIPVLLPRCCVHSVSLIQSVSRRRSNRLKRRFVFFLSRYTINQVKKIDSRHSPSPSRVNLVFKGSSALLVADRSIDLFVSL